MLGGRAQVDLTKRRLWFGRKKYVSGGRLIRVSCHFGQGQRQRAAEEKGQWRLSQEVRLEKE